MHFIRNFLFLWVGSLGMGCASRTVPVSFPPTSAASISGAEAKPSSVIRTLLEDPPLPGESTDQWPGLRPADPQVNDVDHHSNHGSAKSQYVCPMHKEVVSDHEGECPKCGMILVRQP